MAIDNNPIENQMHPWAMGRNAWLFAGSELAGHRAAMVMGLVQSAMLNGHEPWAYLRDVLERLLEHPNHRIYDAAAASLEAANLITWHAAARVASVA